MKYKGVAFLGIMFALLPLIAHAADPALIAVNVTFDLPKCDDKDDNTALSMSVVKSGTVIAEGVNMTPGQKFGDPGTYGPFPLVLKTAVTKSSYDGSTTTLHIDPKGNDTWCANVIVDALFADNSHLKSSSCVVIKVSESNRDAQFVNRVSCQ